MITNEKIEKIKQEVEYLFVNSDKAHDYFHTERVYRNVCSILKYIKANNYIVKAAALLHDTDDYKLNLSQENITNTDIILEKYNFSNADKLFINTIISEVSFSKGKIITSTESKIVQDADRLDALGAIGIARTFTFSGKNNIPIYDSKGSCALNHFHEKLFKLADLMNFEETKRIAIKRTQFMEEYLKQFFLELAEEI
jgi:uncharacterized protein